jgi:acylphosphatase
MIRRTSYFSGNVQGVGFRYTARNIARDFDVKGFVRNLADRRVELVTEGEPGEVDRFLAQIGEEMGQFIKKRTDGDSPATGEFSDFGIRH